MFIAFFVVKISLPVQDGRHFEIPSKFSSNELFAVALYQLSINTLKTSYLPNFVLLTESEQFQHISVYLNQVKERKNITNSEILIFVIYPSTRHLHFDSPNGLAKIRRDP